MSFFKKIFKRRKKQTDYGTDDYIELKPSTSIRKKTEVPPSREKNEKIRRESEEIKFCRFCKGEMKKGSNRISHGLKYETYQCKNCGREEFKLIDIYKG